MPDQNNGSFELEQQFDVTSPVTGHARGLINILDHFDRAHDGKILDRYKRQNDVALMVRLEIPVRADERAIRPPCAGVHVEVALQENSVAEQVEKT